MPPVSPHVQVLILARSYVEPRALHVIAELGIADVIDTEPVSARVLAKTTGANPDAINRLMRLLVSRNIFELRGEEFAHNAASRYLRADHPKSARPFVLMIGSHTNWRAFEELSHSARTGETAMEKLFGETHFPYLAKHPEESAVFNAAMSAKSAADIPAILDAYDFANFTSIADIGGGRGHFLRAVLERHAAIKGVLFDLPQVVAEAEEHPSGRLDIQGGNFFRERLPRAEAYVVWNILHDWADDDCVAIISAVREAAPRLAKLLVLETILPDGAEPSPVRALDIMMMAMNGGRERTAGQYEALLAKGAFKLERIVPVATGLSVLEASPA